jgi:hypothetical protein
MEGAIAKAAGMSATVPFVALVLLIGLSLGAKQAARAVAGGGREIATATLTVGVLMSLLIFS